MLLVMMELGAGIDLAAEAAVGRAGQLVGSPHEGLELVLDLVVELHAPGIEDLEPVVRRRGCGKPRP